MAKYIVNGEITESIGHRGRIFFSGEEFPVNDIDKSALEALIDGAHIIEVKMTKAEQKEEHKEEHKADSKADHKKSAGQQQAKYMDPDSGEVRY